MVAVAPPATLPAIAVASIVSFFVPHRYQDPVLNGALIIVPAIIAFAVIRAGLRKQKWRIRGALVRWGTWAVIMGTLTGFAVRGFIQVSHTAKGKAAGGNLAQLQAADDQYFLENPHRVFIKYEDLVGQDTYIKVINTVAGEEYRPLFPRRVCRTWTVTMPWGTVLTRDHYLDPPYPGDGIQVVKLPDGRRWETTFQGGVPHGPFRGYYADGTLWSEATYEHGRVVGPAWLHTRDGRKIDELAGGAIDPRAFEKTPPTKL